mgnify:CR=1 FL=1
MTTAVDSTRSRIIDAALTHVSNGGLRGVTMTDIARTAGIARQTLYNHYRDVDSIVADAIRRHDDAAGADLDAALAVVETPREKIEQLIRHIATMSTTDRHRLDLDGALAPQHQEMLTRFTKRLDDIIGEVLVEGRADGGFRGDLDVDIDTVLVRQLLAGLSSLASSRPADVAGVTRTATRTILAALASTP